MLLGEINGSLKQRRRGGLDASIFGYAVDCFERWYVPS